MHPDNADLLKIKHSRVAAFAPSRKWVGYNRLQQFDGGYIVPLYSLSAIQTRYGLSQNATRYFRTHILPEPFTIVRIKSMFANHWSRFVLMALDVVMQDLEARGVHQFLRKYEDHVNLVHVGAQYMHDYYTNKENDLFAQQFDKHGVQWM
jgi:hypothetical protein